MQAIIMAAGEGTRMRPLTLTTPKPLVRVNGKPLMEHVFHSLPDAIDDIIVVVGYLGQQIIDYFGSSFQGRKITYVWQTKREGTYRAVELCKPFLKDDPFLVLNADDLFDAQSVSRLVAMGPGTILVSHHDNPQKFGVFEVDSRDFVTGFEEKPAQPKSNLVNCGPMVLTKQIFDFPPKPHANGEYYLPESVAMMISKIPLRVTNATIWIPVGCPEDIPRAEKMLRENKGMT